MKKMRIFYLTLIVLFIACFSISCRSPWDPASRLSGSEKSAWLIFYDGVTTLQDKGDREKAGRLFREVSDKYPESKYDSDSKELADLLEVMLKEDAVWHEPDDIEKMSLQKKIAIYAFIDVLDEKTHYAKERIKRSFIYIRRCEVCRLHGLILLRTG